MVNAKDIRTLYLFLLVEKQAVARESIIKLRLNVFVNDLSLGIERSHRIVLTALDKMRRTGKRFFTQLIFFQLH